MTTKYCQNCGNQLLDVDIKFCSSCGSKIVIPNPQVNEAPSSVAVTKPKLKFPAIAIIVNAGIGIILCLFLLNLMKNPPNQNINDTGRLWLAIGNTLYILLLPVLAFSIYGAFQMMNTRKYGITIASAIITILSGITGPLPWIGIAIGIWALIVLLKSETKAAFESNQK